MTIKLATKIFIAGHNGMVGRAISRQLDKYEDVELVTKSRRELDLCDQLAVKNFLEIEKPDEIIIAAAKVGGIHANNKYPAEFIYQNLQIQSNIIHQAHLCDIQKLLFLGSSCIYPKHALQPMGEDSLLTGVLEATNEPYAIAKIAGIKMCESYNRQYNRDYRSAMPTNLYGPFDNYHAKNSHVVPGLIKRFHEAKTNNDNYVTIWGSGKPSREFLYVDDMAEACIFIHKLEKNEYKKAIDPMLSHINIGSGTDITIHELALMIKEVVNFNGELIFDETKPDGTPKKLMNVSKINGLGWKTSTDLKTGLLRTYEHFKSIKHGA